MNERFGFYGIISMDLDGTSPGGQLWSLMEDLCERVVWPLRNCFGGPLGNSLD